MKIEHDKNARKIMVSQKGYIQKVLRKFGMMDAKPMSIPLTSHFKLSISRSPQPEIEIELMKKNSFVNDVESLMFVTT